MPRPPLTSNTALMLTLQDRLHRRQFLRVGGLSLGGLTLADLLAVKAHAKANKLPLRDKSVIFLFQHGGPSQFETFDPKMDAPRSCSTAADCKWAASSVLPRATAARLRTTR